MRVTIMITYNGTEMLWSFIKFSQLILFFLRKGHPLFFFICCKMCFLILGRSVGRIDKKKTKKNHKKSWNSRPWYPRTTLKVNRHSHIWINKIYNILWKMFMFLFLFFSMLLPCSFFRLKELFQVKNGVTTSLVFFFWKCQKFGSDGRR